jgi:hypothetical protein
MGLPCLILELISCTFLNFRWCGKRGVSPVILLVRLFGIGDYLINFIEIPILVYAPTAEINHFIILTLIVLIILNNHYLITCGMMSDQWRKREFESILDNILRVIVYSIRKQFFSCCWGGGIRSNGWRIWWTPFFLGIMIESIPHQELA